MKCSTCKTERKPSERLWEELSGLMIPCNDPQEANKFKWVIVKLGIVLDEMVETLNKK